MSLTSSQRALVPGVAVVLLVASTVALAGVVAVAAFDVAETPARADAASPAALSVTVVDETITLTHRGGRSLDVQRLRLVVSVDGTSLRHQPPVPFFAATGFRPGPTGPFNEASDPTWSVGESASVRLAGTNAPAVTPGARVVVRVVVDGRPLATLRTTARS